MLLLAHKVSVTTPGLANLLSRAYWLGNSVNQIAFRQLAHFNFKRDDNVVQHLTRMFSTLGNADVMDKTIGVAAQVFLFCQFKQKHRSRDCRFGLLSCVLPSRLVTCMISDVHCVCVCVLALWF